MESFLNIAPWQWWVFGVLLILAEGLVPQAFLVWIGLSAVFTGSVSYLKPELGNLISILLFILTSSVISSIVTQLGYKRAVLKKKVVKKSEIKGQKKDKKTNKSIVMASMPLNDKKKKTRPKNMKKRIGSLKRKK